MKANIDIWLMISINFLINKGNSEIMKRNYKNETVVDFQAGSKSKASRKNHFRLLVFLIFATIFNIIVFIASSIFLVKIFFYLA